MISQIQLPVEKRVITGFGLALIVLVAVGVVAYRNTVGLIDTGRWVTHTQQVLTELEATLSTVTAAEAAQRGYLITGEEEDLAPYRGAVAAVDGHITRLKALTADNVTQQGRITSLDFVVNATLEEMDETIGLRQRGGLEAARQAVLTDVGMQNMSAVRAIIANMESEENSLLAGRAEESEARARNALITFAGLALLGVFILALIYYVITYEDVRRRDAEQKLKKESEFLDILQTVATAANEASTVEDAIQTCLDKVCALTKWPVGHVYFPATDSPGELTPSALWHLDAPKRFSPFRQVTEATRFKSGVGLPGRVFASGKPAWITDFAAYQHLPRTGIAQTVGIGAGFAFPILAGKSVAGVLEFFSTEVVEPDEALLAVMAQVGTQLGRVVEREQMLQALKEMAIRDELTGLANRREMDRLLADEVNRCLRYGRAMSIILVDVDHFKAINDSYGHQAGDEVLRWLGDLIRQHIRLTDHAARYGGEEFAIFLPETLADQAFLVAQLLRSAVAAAPFIFARHDKQTMRISVTVSLGVAGFPDDADSDEGLVKAADRALYRAKRQGRNRAVQADHSALRTVPLPA